MKFTITVEETTSNTFEIEASTPEEALDKAQALYADNGLPNVWIETEFALAQAFDEDGDLLGTRELD